MNLHVSSLASLSDKERTRVLTGLSDETKAALRYHWPFWARPEQIAPGALEDGTPWTYWLILAGRGFGKTRTGAEWVRQEIKSREYVNLIGATSDDVRDIMVEGESGIMACCPPDERPLYKKHESKLEWPNGAVSLCFTAKEPERLRGKQHMSIWADEMAAWDYPATWDQAKFGLRLGPHPRALITTTPRPIATVRELMADPACIVTRGSTYDNRANLAPGFFAEIIRKYEGTRLGRQELMAEVLEDNPGALWRRSVIDRDRVTREMLPDLQRVVVAIDPAVSTGENSNETGIIVVGLGEHARDGERHGYVLEDASGVYSPDEWSRIAAACYHRWQADRFVAEGNQGGNLVEQVIRSVDSVRRASVRMVHASRGKVTRAEPASALYEQGRVHHVGPFDTLEDQMVAFTPDFDRKAQGYSPDRVDALVWALEDLFPQVVRKAPRLGREQTYQPKPREF